MSRRTKLPYFTEKEIRKNFQRIFNLPILVISHGLFSCSQLVCLYLQLSFVAVLRSIKMIAHHIYTRVLIQERFMLNSMLQMSVGKHIGTEAASSNTI